MEALLVSPLRPWQIVVGKVAPYLAIGFVSVAAVLVEARLIFHVPIAVRSDGGAARVAAPALADRRRQGGAISRDWFRERRGRAGRSPTHLPRADRRPI